MNIALDFDDTYTVDPEFWGLFLQLCRAKKHNVYIVTMRHDNKDNKLEIESTISLPVPIIFCGMKWKNEIVESQGIRIDVWIDDSPQIIKDASKLDMTYIDSLEEE